jgi:hypothetical protein
MEPEARQIDEKINTIIRQFFSALDDFKKYYVYYNKNPEVNEFQNFYANSKGQLQTLSKDMFLVTNEIDKRIEALDLQVRASSMQLEDEKKLNVELMKLFKDIQNTHVGSEILIDDSKEIYNAQYYYNWELLIGVLVTSGLLFYIFKPKMAMTLTTNK